MPGTAKKDLVKEFDKRLRHFKFRANKLKVDEWKRTNIVNDVYDIEMQQRFKSLEERLLYRMEVWIDVCRIETMRDGVLTKGSGKFHSSKRFRKQDGKLTKVRSFSLGKFSAKSVDDIRNAPTTPQGKNLAEEERQKLPGPLKKKSSKGRTPSMSPAYSTSDLLDKNHRHPEQVFNDVTTKYGTAPKRKFRFFLFGGSKKDREETKKEKNKRKRDGKDFQDEESSQNNNLSSNGQRIRPSLFDMESIKGSIPELSKTSITNGYEQHDYDPDKKIQKASGSKFNTVIGVPTQGTLFQSTHNDSFRSKKKKSQKSNLQSPLFYDPQRKETELGHI